MAFPLPVGHCYILIIGDIVSKNKKWLIYLSMGYGHTVLGKEKEDKEQTALKGSLGLGWGALLSFGDPCRGVTIF